MLWRPECPCDETCLPAGPLAPRPAHPLVQLGRWIRAAWALLSGAVALMLAPSARAAQAGRAPTMARALLAALGIRWAVMGAPVRAGALLAGNHVSWLDILVMMAMDGPPARKADGRPLRLVAKSEVGAWPLIGRLARLCGTIFVDRGRPRSLPGTVAQVRQALSAGYPVQVFPEGTTTCGAHPAPWRPAFLQAALDAGAPVQRFTLLFSTAAAAFVAEETLFSSLRRVIAVRNLTVTVLIDEPIPVSGDRRRLARQLSPRRSSKERVYDRGRA